MSKVTEFLENRVPFYIDENGRIRIPPANKRAMPLVKILNEEGLTWMGALRGYKKDNFLMLYSILDYLMYQIF